MEKIIHSEDELAQTAQEFVSRLSVFPSVVFLEGELGAGKTTFVRKLLQAMGYQGKVKSPTYTLVESYDLPQGSVYHFDLYRLRNPEELHALGVQEYFSEGLCLIEWPERAASLLPQPTWKIQFQILNETDRRLVITSGNAHE